MAYSLGVFKLYIMLSSRYLYVRPLTSSGWYTVSWFVLLSLLLSPIATSSKTIHSIFLPCLPYYLNPTSIDTPASTSLICSAVTWPSSPTSLPASHCLISNSLHRLPAHFLFWFLFAMQFLAAGLSSVCRTHFHSVFVYYKLFVNKSMNSACWHLAYIIYLIMI